MNPRRLTRCRHDRQLAGVAAGMAEYLDLDPTVVRILWILSAFVGGFTILLYIILAFVMPLEPVSPESGAFASTGFGAGATGTGVAGEVAGEPTTTAWVAPAAAGHVHRSRGDGRWGLGLGIVLVVFGSIALVGSVVPGWLAGIALGPAFVVALGVGLLFVALRRPTAES